MKPTFKIRVKAYIIQVIAIRQHIIRFNKGWTMDATFIAQMEEMLNKLSFVESDKGAACFLVKNESLIKAIIPGEKAGCHKKKTEELEELLKEANNNYIKKA